MLITRNEDGRIAPATSCIDLWGKFRSKKYVGLRLVATHVQRDMSMYEISVFNERPLVAPEFFVYLSPDRTDV